MIVRIALILVASLLAIRFYQYISKSKQVPEKKSKQKNFSSIKKDDVKDAEFEDIKGDDSV